MDNEVSKQSDLAKTSSAIALTTVNNARELVLRYANTLVGKERAQEFITQLGFLIRTNPKIAHCTPESIFTSMMQCIRLDLIPNTPEQFAALIPYGKELQFQLMYPGGIELAYRSGVVSTIKADVVFPEDDFDYDDAINYIHHKKDLTIDRTKAENIIAAYAVGKLDNGELMFEVMSPSEIKKIKDRSVKAKGPDSPWSQWEERMIRKSPLKRLFNVLPSSTKDNRFKEAAHWDSLSEAGKRVKADPQTGQIIEYSDLEEEKATEQEKQEILAVNQVKEDLPETKEMAPKESVREKAKRLYIDKHEDNKEDQELLETLRNEQENDNSL